MPTKLRRLRPLNSPLPLAVETSPDGLPATVTLSRRKLAVTAHHESWRIKDEWWRDYPVSRHYFRVGLEDGRSLDIFHDLAGGGWFRQAYG
jgi:hypothetical protein